jgi:6-pyruvoyltetrahydropterin/6-carboxytetrahydropterin synthase
MQCTRRIQFCAGHRVLGHEGKCRNIHGHNYVALITAESELDAIGRVIDFSVLKERVGGWIDQAWDHKFIANSEDGAIIEFLDSAGFPVFILQDNPTAENMAKFLLQECSDTLMAGTGVRVVKVRIWETENCYADACSE